LQRIAASTYKYNYIEGKNLLEYVREAGSWDGKLITGKGYKIILLQI